mgnify:CR=1 FL=1
MVLDPFSGTGTTIHAAEVHGRDGIGIARKVDEDPVTNAGFFSLVLSAIAGTNRSYPGLITPILNAKGLAALESQKDGRRDWITAPHFVKPFNLYNSPIDARECKRLWRFFHALPLTRSNVLSPPSPSIPVRRTIKVSLSMAGSGGT